MALLVRQELTEAIAQARQHVLHGHSSLAVALRMVRVGLKRLPLSREAQERLADYLRSARADVHTPGAPVSPALERAAKAVSALPWEDEGGLTRAQVLDLLDTVNAAVRSTPTKNLGPLFPGLR